jgi:hypothetical protein
VPATRSGLTGKTGMPGDMASFVGDWGSIGIGLSFNRARLTVLQCFLGCGIGDGFCERVWCGEGCSTHELGRKQSQPYRLPAGATAHGP